MGLNDRMAGVPGIGLELPSLPPGHDLRRMAEVAAELRDEDGADVRHGLRRHARYRDRLQRHVGLPVVEAEPGGCVDGDRPVSAGVVGVIANAVSLIETGRVEFPVFACISVSFYTSAKAGDRTCQARWPARSWLIVAGIRADETKEVQAIKYCRATPRIRSSWPSTRHLHVLAGDHRWPRRPSASGRPGVRDPRKLSASTRPNMARRRPETARRKRRGGLDCRRPTWPGRPGASVPDQASNSSAPASRATVDRPLPSQAASRPSVPRRSACRPARKPSKASTPRGSNRRSSGSSGVRARRLMRRSIPSASSSWAENLAVRQRTIRLWAGPGEKNRARAAIASSRTSFSLSAGVVARMPTGTLRAAAMTSSWCLTAMPPALNALSHRRDRRRCFGFASWASDAGDHATGSRRADRPRRRLHGIQGRIGDDVLRLHEGVIRAGLLDLLGMASWRLTRSRTRRSASIEPRSLCIEASVDDFPLRGLADHGLPQHQRFDDTGVMRRPLPRHRGRRSSSTPCAT